MYCFLLFRLIVFLDYEISCCRIIFLSADFNGLSLLLLSYNISVWAFQVYLYGGHVTSWKNDHGEELLFVSSKVLCSNLMLILSIYHFVFVEVNSVDCNYKPLKGMSVHAFILSL